VDDLIRLIEPSIPSLRRYARALVRDATEADDLVQDCLERAIGRWSQRKEASDARSWLFSILHNLAISRWRRLSRRGREVSLDELNEADLAERATQQDSVNQSDILRSLAALPQEYRSVLLLVGVEDLSYAQAAKVLDVPIGTVMSRLSRGRARLAQIMANGSATQVRTPLLRRIK